MAQPRFRRVPTPGYPLVGNAATRMPDFGVKAYYPTANDIAPGAQLERDLEGGYVPLSDIINFLTARNRPPQLVQAAYYTLITGLGVANKKLLVPKNPLRQSIKISNPSALGNITFSYDSPILLAGMGMGIPVASGTYDEESNGSVSINGIWVWSDQASATFPIPVIAYEGVLSVAGNHA
jgi:hypothetical protein